MHLPVFLQSQLLMNVRAGVSVYVDSNWVDCTNGNLPTGRQVQKEYY